MSLKKLILVGSRQNLTDIVYTAQDLGYEVDWYPGQTLLGKH
jgi:hypothetical protein